MDNPDKLIQLYDWHLETLAELHLLLKELKGGYNR